MSSGILSDIFSVQCALMYFLYFCQFNRFCNINRSTEENTNSWVFNRVRTMSKLSEDNSKESLKLIKFIILFGSLGQYVGSPLEITFNPILEIVLHRARPLEVINRDPQNACLAL